MSTFDFTSIGIKYLILPFNKVLEPATCTTAALILSSFHGNNSLRSLLSKTLSWLNHSEAMPRNQQEFQGLRFSLNSLRESHVS